MEHVWTHAAIQRWAEQEYLSGAPPILFTRGHKEVVVVLGSHTSGLPSTEIVVFSGNAGGPYERMLVRSTFYGNVRVHDDGEALVFTARDPVLIIPWTGVVADLEQVPPK